MMTLGQLGTGAPNRSSLINPLAASYRQMGPGVGLRGGQVRTANSLNPQGQAMATQAMGMAPEQRAAFYSANQGRGLDPSMFGLTNGMINGAQGGNNPGRYNMKTGTFTAGDPGNAAAAASGGTAGPMTGLGSMGGAPGNPALGGGVGGNAGPLGGAGSPGMGLGNPISDPVGGNTTLGGIGSGNGGASAGGLINSQIVPSLTEAPGNYTGGMDMSKYLNPEADFARQEGLKGIQSTYAGAGNLLSGPAMKGISDYASKSAINQSYQPAFNNYMQDKGFNYGVDSGDRAFGYQAKLNDQTIPFNQQMQLGQLGLQGAQGQQSVQNLLATLLSQNSIAAGQAQGTGTMGQGNALSSALSSMLSNYLNQNMLNRIPGLNPAGGP